MSKRPKPKLDPNLAALRSAAKLPIGSARANKEASLVGPELLDARVRIASDLSVWSAVADVCARLVHNGEVEPLLAELLAVAIKVTGVDAGFIRVIPCSSTPVGIMASQGAVAGMVDVAQKLIGPASVLIPEQTRVSFDDLRLIQTKKPDALLQAAVAAGFRGFQATPLLSRLGPKIGSLYTFSNRPGRFNARDLYVLDILCRQVADFIDWRLAGAEVTRADAHLRSILDSTLDAIVTVDSEGIVRSANSATLKIFGMDPVALVGQNIGVLASEATRAQWTSDFMASIDHSVHDHGVGCRIDLRTVHADGRKVEVEIIVTPVVGEPLFTAAIRDVTERRATAEKLVQANRLASIGTLAAGLGHDMNNVLFPIRAHLNALHIQGTARAAVDDIGHVNAIGQGVAYLQQLADGLHYLVKGDPDDAEFGPATRLNEWWSRVGTLIVQSLPANVDVTMAIPQDLPAVQVSQQQLTQAVLNLVVNAGEAIASRGAGWPGHVVISAAISSVGHSVVLSVNDDGVGMPEAVRERAMDTFFTTKVRGLGTGLGLALVARVLRHAGGSVIVQSREGEGSTISLELPIADRRARFAEIKVAVTLADGRAASFLVATLTARGLTSVTLDDASDADVWMVDPRIVTPQEALAWREIRSGRRVVRFGKANPGRRAEWSAVAAATVERTEDFDDLLLGAGRACDIIAELQHQSASTTRRIER